MKKIKKLYCEELYYKLNSKLISNNINIEIFCTDCCNYNCYYCVNLNDGYVRQNKFLDFDKIYNLIIWLYSKYKKHICITLIGGEPTLHPNLL
jgi:molybdenum cofactor biosynthesis enzyme MoaA